uniref:Uncharacterized protein n=1 Tax=Plectus sambesii TaxID=2011161 RepID=A0A914UN17_9BILA
MEELLWLVVGVGGVLFAIQKPWLTVLLLLLLLLALTNYDHIRPLLETAFVGLSEQHRQRRSQERGFVPRIEPVFARREHSAGETTPPVDEEQDSPSATHSLSDFFQSRFERLFRIRTYQVPRMVEYYEGMTTSFSSPSPPSSPMSLSVTGAADELEDCQ